jgi:hypothetical protein
MKFCIYKKFNVEAVYQIIILIIIICELTKLQIYFAHADVQNHMKYKMVWLLIVCLSQLKFYQYIL